MKLIYVVLFIALFAGCSYLMPKGPKGADSPEHLLELTKKYHVSKDVKNMMRLYKTNEVPKVILASKERWLKKVFSYELKDIKFEELPKQAQDFFNKPVAAGGQTVAFNIYLEAQLTASYAGNRQEGFLLGQDTEDGKYYFGLQIPQ